MQDMKHLQACDSYRWSNNIPVPIPLLAARHPLTGLHLSGWLELQQILQISSHPQCMQGSSRNFNSRRRRRTRFLALSYYLSDTAQYPTGLSCLLQAPWIACTFNTGGFESQSRAPLHAIQCLPLPRQEWLSINQWEGDCLCLSFSPAFPYWHETACKEILGAVAA